MEREHMARPRPRSAPRLGVAILATLWLAGGIAGTAHAQGDAGPPAGRSPRQQAAVGPGRHAVFSQLLEDHVRDGVVDYAALKRREAELDRYLASLAATDPGRLSRDEQLALWINAYNAFTLKLILRHYPGIESIKDIPQRWSTREWDVGGQLYSLEAIEHEILRKRFTEPRIHFAINCASRSCPDLASEAYTAERLETQLNRAATRFLSDPDKGLRTRREAGLLYGHNHYVYVSKIFDWFEEDFEKAAGSVSAYVAPFATAADRAFLHEHADDLSVRYLDYDWSLNGR